MKTGIRGRNLASGMLLLLLSAGALPLGHDVFLKSAQASGPWNGHAVAFTFTTDDGNRPDNLTWAEIFTARGLSFTVFIPSSWVGWTDRDKLTAADLSGLHLNGIEIGSHGKTHVRLTDLSDELLLDELLGSCLDLEAAVGAGYYCRTIGYPEHAHDLRVMGVVDSLGFTAARDGGSNPAGYPNFSLGKSTWAETNLYELPLTVVASYLVGTDNSYSEAETRAQVQKLLGGTISSQNYWVNIYAHTLNDIDAAHMTWVVDELQQSDVWIDNFAAVADYYRQGHGLPIPIGVGLPTPVLLLRFVASPRFGEIVLEWVVSQEASISGFRVYRSTAPGSGYAQVTSEPIPPAESFYQFVDEDVSPGVTYHYRLEALDRAGTSEFFGPISARVELSDTRGPGPFLGQAAPNPFQGRASTIPFSLPQPGNVTVRILDLSGRSVRTLIDQGMDGGDHSILWDGLDDRGDSVPAGIYFYEILTREFKAARKLVRLR